MKSHSSSMPVMFLSFLLLTFNAFALDVHLTQIDSFNVDYTVSQIEYSPVHQLLFLREATTSVHVIDLVTNLQIANQPATEEFTDMDLTSDSNYLFVADYGDERTGYGTPINPHYVHRYDLVNRSWAIAQAPMIAWKIEAVSADRVLLQEHDQHVDMTLNSFGAFMAELSRISADYYGDFEYDPYTQRVYHGCSGSSSREIHVRRVFGDSLVNEGNTGVYGTAQSGGGTSVLSTDGNYFYYGKLQVEAMDIRNNLRSFPENIYAASDHIAFGTQRYYFADTGIELGTLGYSTTVYGVSEDGKHIWACESAGSMLHHYTINDSTTNNPPVACIEGENRLVEAVNEYGAAVSFDASCSTDLDSTEGSNDDIVEFNWYEKIVDGNDTIFNCLAAGPIVDIDLPLGEHIIVLEVIDTQGDSAQTEVAVIVEDTAAPQFMLRVSPNVLWPANHKLIEVTPSWTVSDNCDNDPTVSLLTITIREDGKKTILKNNEKTADAFVDTDGKIYLKAERNGNSSSRVYVLTFQAVDDYANTTVQTVSVTVPHDQSSLLKRKKSQNSLFKKQHNVK